jgi:hypothetical protein
MDLPLSIFAAYVEIGATVYLAAVDAAEQGLKGSSQRASL